MMLQTVAFDASQTLSITLLFLERQIKGTALLGTGRIVFLTCHADWPLDCRICISCLDYTWTSRRAFTGMENSNWSLSQKDLLVSRW